jgi:hypothetical protein
MAGVVSVAAAAAVVVEVEAAEGASGAPAMREIIAIMVAEEVWAADRHHRRGRTISRRASARRPLNPHGLTPRRLRLQRRPNPWPGPDRPTAISSAMSRSFPSRYAGPGAIGIWTPSLMILIELVAHAFGMCAFQPVPSGRPESLCYNR